MISYPHGAHGLGTERRRLVPLPASPPTITHLDRLRAEALDVITYAGRADEQAHAFFLRGLDAEDPELLRRAWEAATADFTAAHPPRVLLLDAALREGREVEVDGAGAHLVNDEEESS